MASTPYHPERRDYSQHIVTKWFEEFSETIWKKGLIRLKYPPTTSTDPTYTVYVGDRTLTLKVTVRNIYSPKGVNRRKAFPHITIAEWNHMSGTKGQLYKLKQDIFLHIFVDQNTNTIEEFLICDNKALTRAILTEEIPHTLSNPNSGKQQTLCEVNITDIINSDIEHRHYAIDKSRTHV